VETLCSLEGNHRTCITLAMHHGLCGLYTYWLNGHRKGAEHPTFAPIGVWHLYLFIFKGREKREKGKKGERTGWVMGKEERGKKVR